MTEDLLHDGGVLDDGENAHATLTPALLERSLLQYEFTGSEREGRGPVVVLVDDSDSMDGERFLKIDGSLVDVNIEFSSRAARACSTRPFSRSPRA